MWSGMGSRKRFGRARSRGFVTLVRTLAACLWRGETSSASEELLSSPLSIRQFLKSPLEESLLRRGPRTYYLRFASLLLRSAAVRARREGGLS